MLQRNETGDEKGALGKWFGQSDNESCFGCGGENESPCNCDQHNTIIRVQSWWPCFSLHGNARQIANWRTEGWSTAQCRLHTLVFARSAWYMESNIFCTFVVAMEWNGMEFPLHNYICVPHFWFQDVNYFKCNFFFLLLILLMQIACIGVCLLSKIIGK